MKVARWNSHRFTVFVHSYDCSRLFYYCRLFRAGRYCRLGLLGCVHVY